MASAVQKMSGQGINGSDSRPVDQSDFWVSQVTAGMGIIGRELSIHYSIEF